MCVSHGNHPVSWLQIDLKVIRAKNMYMYHMGIAQYFGCKVDLKVIRAKDMYV